jgi:hypothetical protein
MTLTCGFDEARVEIKRYEGFRQLPKPKLESARDIVNVREVLLRLEVDAVDI